MAVLQAEPSGALGGPSVVARRRRAPRWLRAPEVALPSAVLLLVVAACFLAPVVFSLPSPVDGNVLQSNLPLFSPGHFLGTDPVGNDTLSEVLNGGQVSLEIALATNALALVVGGVLGTLAGFRGGATDAAIMRVFDVFIAFPSIVLALVLAEALKPSELHVIWALSFFAVPSFARIARAATLRLREQNFVLAARLGGMRTMRTLYKHVAPLVVPQLLTFALLFLGVTVLVSAALSYLGLSVPPPDPTWGNMIAAGQPYLSTHPALVLIPSGFLFVTVLSLNILGDALRARWAAT